MIEQLAYLRPQKCRLTQSENNNKIKFSLECFHLQKQTLFCFMGFVPDTGVTNMQDEGKEE